MTKVLNREHVQAMVKALRGIGIEVTGNAQQGYRADVRGTEVFGALPGRNGTYLVKHHRELFA